MNRQTDKQTDIDTLKSRQTDSQKGRDTNFQTDRHMNRHGHIDRQMNQQQLTH